MPDKPDRAELLERFVVALGDLTCEAVNTLPTEQKKALDAALSTKAAVVQFAIGLDPLTVVGFLASTTNAVEPMELFRIETGFPSGAAH